MMPNAKGLTEKLGVNFDVVKTNPYADFGNLTRPMNDGEKGLMQMYVNNGYELFLTRCSDGRGISMEELDKIAQGRVWTGSTAKNWDWWTNWAAWTRRWRLPLQKRV